MPRFVFDTNILISALFFDNSKPAKAFHKAFTVGEMLFSVDTFTELEEVLWRKKMDRYIPVDKRIQFLHSYLQSAVPVEIITKISLCRDPKDNRFLELAVNGNASFIITGDEDLLVLNPFQEIRILTPEEFLTVDFI